ncbi:sigma-70 family RNA polymerase sigma factor [Streptomyces sp. WAC06614]|uniref:sigma-70 family RNA polymerase sigma factor n=1 Tax=Streptomyces sp. WAC06614 TaxID=2487416 RepID=UPI000F7A0CB1|nr:sigma-70 family RNA polymerase sigma factor [Streptomyces sp. WAC06614]RSS75548.1 sigma-70 family RNA polymerase sigma factor [Streptomyces sp. WAC06614]
MTQQHTRAKGSLPAETVQELYRLHGPTLLRSLLKVTRGDLGRAEDILQETLTRAWQHPEAIGPNLRECRPWLFTVARRIAIDHHRRVAARPVEISGEHPEEATAVPLPAPDPYEEVLGSYDMTRALAELKPHHRAVVVELHLRGRSLAQAAETLGIPVGTVKSRNFVAIRALRPILESRGHALDTAA